MFFHHGGFSFPFWILIPLAPFVVACVAIICRYLERSQTSRRAAGDDKALGELWQSASRMEQRIEALEKILDSEAPGWRMRAGE
jgi:phage shock protein B